MKKVLAIVAALVMAIGATAAFAEEPAKMTFSGGVEYNMDMDQVRELLQAIEGMPTPEIDKDLALGGIEFWELEYENIKSYDGFTADAKYLFVGNSLVAIHYDFAKGTSYDEVKKQLTASYGEAVPFSAAQIGNGKYAIDDDGEVKDCREMIVADGAIFVLEQDDDGDVDVTILDPAAAYLFS